MHADVKVEDEGRFLCVGGGLFKGSRFMLAIRFFRWNSYHGLYSYIDVIESCGCTRKLSPYLGPLYFLPAHSQMSLWCTLLAVSAYAKRSISRPFPSGPPSKTS